MFPPSLRLPATVVQIKPDMHVTGGAFGDVYRVPWTIASHGDGVRATGWWEEGRTGAVAVKLPRSSVLNRRKVLCRTIREALTWSIIEHENVIPLLGISLALNSNGSASSRNGWPTGTCSPTSPVSWVHPNGALHPSPHCSSFCLMNPPARIRENERASALHQIQTRQRKRLQMEVKKAGRGRAYYVVNDDVAFVQMPRNAGSRVRGPRPNPSTQRLDAATSASPALGPVKARVRHGRSCSAELSKRPDKRNSAAPRTGSSVATDQGSKPANLIDVSKKPEARNTASRAAAGGTLDLGKRTEKGARSANRPLPVRPARPPADIQRPLLRLVTESEFVIPTSENSQQIHSPYSSPVGRTSYRVMLPVSAHQRQQQPCVSTTLMSPPHTPHSAESTSYLQPTKPNIKYRVLLTPSSTPTPELGTTFDWTDTYGLVI
ncbi:hypothetical protein DACRYDRAFT_18838 [Dacryopinax primogenitus]|uniref:Protein kinase domain-containing protein n=1 Tax=Dacryopinax primogenitus (strain DJM 731) TaxID=1858805 RepID=M5FPG9_DACPD|nr:uncharacterized protein DACRYDRAFT_18838 [Dacryopinax primogenitus]EJT97068.1 hypothetical protein DACRYDRAFT_18838 [Dacryopinax primogenitus]